MVYYILIFVPVLSKRWTAHLSPDESSRTPMMQEVIGWEILRKDANAIRCFELTLGFLDIVVTTVSIIVTIIGIRHSKRNDKHQKSNPSDQD